MKILRYKLSSILLIMSAFGCTASDIAPEKTEHELNPLTPVELRAKTSVNQLSADLLKAKLSNALSDNAMVSSVSLYYALSVLERGADSHSHELLRTFLLEDNTETLAPLASALANHIVYPAMADRPQYGQFLLANAIWATNGETNGLPFVFSPAFKQDAEKFYQASSYALDFMAKGASEPVNDWAYENTNGLIPNIMDDQTLQAFEWMITNAAYFEGAWSVPMQKLPANGQFEFRSLVGSRERVESIVSEKFRARVFDRDDKSTLVSIPFRGGKYSFVAFMPPNEDNLDDTDTERWILDTAVPELPEMIDELSKAAITHVTVQMPTFSFEDGFEMQAASELTHQLGLADLFKNSADFSRLVDTKKTALSLQRTKVGLIKQNSKIELDEKGVKAAAVTLIAGVKATSAPRPFIPRALIMDRPFVFAIMENRSGTMLFNGVMTKPGTSPTSGK